MELGGMTHSGVLALATAKQAEPMVPLDALEYFKRYPYEYAADKKGAQAFLHYNRYGFLSINGALRGHDVMDRSQARKVRRLVKHLDQLFDQVPLSKESIRVYRGMQQLPYRDAASRARFDTVNQLIDKPFIEAAYVSTSTRQSVAESFTGRYGMLMELEIPAGTPLCWAYAMTGSPFEQDRDQGFQNIKSETELLLPRGGKIRLVEQLEDKQVHAHTHPVMRGHWTPA